MIVVKLKEYEIQRLITKALLKMPDVAFYTTNTSGKAIYQKRWVTIGKWFNGDKENNDGLSDITGMKIDGTYFAIEVKVPGKKPTKDQLRFINFILDHDGLAGYATNVQEAEEIVRGFQIRI
ncbi:MAG: VRR-NUC domain-containing protein [Thiohalomonadales bacterium]